jgi:hypothetical protein
MHDIYICRYIYITSMHTHMVSRRGQHNGIHQRMTTHYSCVAAGKSTVRRRFCHPRQKHASRCTHTREKLQENHPESSFHGLIKESLFRLTIYMYISSIFDTHIYIYIYIYGIERWYFVELWRVVGSKAGQVHHHLTKWVRSYSSSWQARL